MRSLTHKHCVPCQGDSSPLDEKEANTLLAQLHDSWQINSEGHLYKRYVCTGFMEAIEFACKIAIIAEQEAHHPNLTIFWGACCVEIWTHKINGLTENDFILAAKIETIT